MPRPPSAPTPPTRQAARQSGARPSGRSTGGSSGRVWLLLLVPLIVLTIPGVIFSHSLLTSANKPVTVAGGASTPKGAGLSTGAPTSPASAGSGATTLNSLGTVKSSFTLKPPARPAKGSYVVYVIDGPMRFLRTESSSPYTTKLNSTLMKDGDYTITVLTVRKGKPSVASTETLTVNNSGAKATTTPSATPSASPSTKGLSGAAAQVLSLTNAQRATAGCKALTANAKLTKAAQDHSVDMARNNYFDHNSQNGKTPFDRMTADGYNFQAAAENIAEGQSTPAAVMSAWMNSAGHKANILNCTYTDIGIGYAVSSAGTAYWTQDVGKPF
jgi:uncharacterized protein YkwD